MCSSRRVFSRFVATASGVFLVLGAVVGTAALAATPAGASGTHAPVVKAVIKPAPTGTGRTTRSDAASQSVKPPSGGSYSVNLGYADTLRPNPANFPTPWNGDPHVVYEGCTPAHTCAFDGGAVEVVNTSTASETVGSVVITFAADCVYNIWPHNVALPKGDELVVTELEGGGPGGCTVTTEQMDSSDIGPTGSNWAGNCNQSAVIPLITVTVNGKTTQFRDSTQILNTKGVDANSCGHPNESEQWTPVGSTVCYGATLSLTPSTTKVKPGATVTMTSKLLNSCGDPLAGVPVTLAVSKGPDSGTTDTVTTNASGVAKFVYKSSSTQGIDFLKATVTNLVGTISSPVSTIFNEKAALTVTPAAALPGATVKFTGTGFGANESVSLHGNTPTAPTLTTVTANATGAISGSFVVPVPTSGGAMSEVVAVGATTGNQGWALFSSTCTDDWASPANGNWETATNWSTGAVPGANDNACVIVTGTYTVTLENSASVSSLTLGTAATKAPGTQTLNAQAAAAGGITLTASGGTSITKHGVMALGSLDADNAVAVNGGPIINHGVFKTVAGAGGTRYLRSNLTNDAGATATFGATTNQDSGTTTTNNGSLSISTGAQLTVTNGSSVFDQAAGTFTNAGTFYMNGSTFDAAGGSESGHAAVIQSSTFNDAAGAGAYTFQCSNTLKGTIPTGQTVTVQANGCGGATTYLTGAVTNAGTLKLDSTDADNNAVLQADAGASLTNNGAFDVLADAGGGRYLRVILTNNGTVTIGATTNQDSGTTTINNSAFTVAPGAQLNVTNGSSVFDQAAGTLTDSGTFYMNGSTFDATGGAEAGNAAILQSSTFNDSAGTGSYLLQCGNTLKGGIPASQTVTVQANGCGGATTYLTGAIVNAGTLRLDSIDADNNAVLQADSGASLTNSGTFDVVAGAGGGRYLRVSLTNNGTVTIGATTNQDSGTTTVNNRTFTIAPGAQLNVTNGSSVFDQAAGTFTVSGTFYMNGSTFDAAGGAEKGSAAILQSSTFNDSAGTGSYLLQCGNNLNGTVPKGQTVNVEANGCGSATVNLGSSGVTNNGTLELSSVDADNYSLMQGGPLTNHGTFETLAGNGGVEYIRVTVVNAANGKEVIDGVTTRQDSNTSTTNQGSFTLGAGVSYSMSGGSTFTESTAPTFGVTVTAATDSTSPMTGGSASVTGTLSITTLGTPTTGEAFVPVTVSMFSGTFSTVQASPHTYHVAYGTHGFTLTAA